jgi:hypothetical protein
MSTTAPARIELRIDASGIRERRIVASDPATRAALLEAYERIEPLIEHIDRRLREHRAASDDGRCADRRTVQ